MSELREVAEAINEEESRLKVAWMMRGFRFGLKDFYPGMLVILTTPSRPWFRLTL